MTSSYTLYYSPGSCALIVHILLEEFGVAFEAVRVDTDKGEHRREEYRRINPKQKVPALATPDGVLTECVAIIEYLCDKHDEGRLLGKPGSWQRARTMERIATLATEIHPLFMRYFHQDDFSPDESVQDQVKERGAEKLLAWFREEDAGLKTPYWSGDTLTAADLYFTVVTRWGRWLTPPANEMRNIRPFYERMLARPAVKRAMEREGVKGFGTT
jgi:glutathione S-transferase